MNVQRLPVYFFNSACQLRTTVMGAFGHRLRADVDQKFLTVSGGMILMATSPPSLVSVAR